MSGFDQRAYSREYYARNWGGAGRGALPKPPTIPADVVILNRDPSPCFRCGVRADVGCKHRSAA